MRTPIRLAFLLIAIVFFAALFVPVCGCETKASAKRAVCLSNLKQQVLGEIMYAGDHDDRFTPREVWMDGIAPYVKEARVFHDLELPKGAYGYAFNGVLSTAKSPKHAETVPLIYDSLNPVRNASDLVTSSPHPGRHGGKNAIAYADGHARMVRTR